MESMKPDYEARPVAKGRLPDVQGLLFLRERERDVEGEKETERDREREKR